MNFEEFEHKARLYVVGALDAEETTGFQAARKEFGQRAEDFIRECRKLSSLFALSLRPQTPKPDAKEKLLARIQAGLNQSRAAGDA